MGMRTQLSLVLLLLAAGCRTPVPEGDLPEKRPLGRSYTVFTAPQTPNEEERPERDALPVTDVLTKHQAVAWALRYNPELQAASWTIRAAQARQWQQSMRPNPSLEIELENVAGSGAFSGTDAAETTLGLGQSVEMAGKRHKRGRVAALESQLAGWDYEAKRLAVLTKTSRAFVEVLAMQERAHLAEQQVQLAEQVATTVDQRVNAGKDSPMESTKARLASAQIRIEQQRIARHLSTLRQDLAANWGAAPARFQRVEGRWESITTPPEEITLSPLVGRHPTIARWNTEIERHRALIELEEARAVPDPTVLAAFRRFKDPVESAFVFGVSLPLPTANRNQGAIRAARIGLARAQQQRAASLTDVRTQLVRAYAMLSSAYGAAAELQRAVLPAALEAFDSAQTGYRAGKFGFLVVLDAQRTLFEVRMQHLEALAEYHQARAQVEHLIGQPLESL